MKDSSLEYRLRVLREGQYRIETNRYILEAPRVFKKTREQEIDESLQRIENLKEEIRSLENEINTKIEKSERAAEEIVEKAEMEAERIVKEAEKSAFDRVQKSLEDQEKIIEEKRREADDIIAEARREAEKILAEAREEALRIRQEAQKEGFARGHEEGFVEGREELKSMVERLKQIIYATIQEREKILVHSEQQILNLIVTMVKKVVKRLTVEEQNVVLNNAKEALSLVRGAMRVYIHVNPEDYNFTVQHKEELIRMIEGMPEVKFFENPAVDRGGVLIETDIGEVDATIATQLEELENKIEFYIPARVKTKGVDEIVRTEQSSSEPKEEKEIMLQ
ncbi:MAG: flagellar assembly protein FliH [Brevinematales bacterium]